MRSIAISEPNVTRAARELRTRQLVEVSFFLFLLLVFVTLEPFKQRDLVREISAGEGDIARQIAYFLLFSTLAVLYFRLRGLRGLSVMPASLTIVLGWCLLSSVWSLAPEITLRRAGLTTMVAVSVLLAIDMMGAQRALKILRFLLIGLLAVNFLSVLLIPQAVHSIDELNPALVGNWRGVHFQKNIAGSVAALSALLFLHVALTERRLSYWFLTAAAAVFTIGSHAKTSIGLLALVALASTFYRFADKHPSRRKLFAGAFSLFLFCTIALALLLHDRIAGLLSDPSIFTGRSGLWQIVIPYVKEHPLLGSGFGAFWHIGNASPAIYLARENWHQYVGHSHNGYLEMLITTGIIGLVISLIALVLVPLKKLISFPTPQAGLAFSWVLFCILGNLLEFWLLARDGPEWVIFLIALALLRRGDQECPKEPQTLGAWSHFGRS